MSLAPPSESPAGSPLDQHFSQVWVHHAAGTRHLPPELRKENDHRRPVRSIKVDLDIILDDVSTRKVSGRRVHYGRQLRHIGGMRIGVGESEPVAHARAAMAAWKLALAGIPHGGASGSVELELADLAPSERQRFARRLARELLLQPGLRMDTMFSLTPEDDEVFHWMAAEIEERTLRSESLREEDRRLGLAALPANIDASVNAIRAVIAEAWAQPSGGLDGARISVHGLNPLGWSLARALKKAGARIIGMGDSTGTVYEPQGLDVTAAVQASLSGGLRALTNVLVLPVGSTLSIPCDFLVLTEPLDKMTHALARKTRARTIVEAADALLPPEADALLGRHRVRIIPDLVAASGADVAAYLAWLQETRGERWTTGEVDERVETHVREAMGAVVDTAEQLNVPMRQAAHALAARRMALDHR